MNLIRKSQQARPGILLYALITVAWALYVLLLLLGPNDPATSDLRFGLTTANLLRVSFALPVLFIWLIAARAVNGFIHYARLITGTPEERGFRIIARGLSYLIAYLILLLVLGRLTPLLANTPTLSLIGVFIKNHLPVYLLLIAMVHLYYGSSLLLHTMNLAVPRGRLISVWIGYFIFSGAFTYVFFGHPMNPISPTTGLPAFAVPHNVLLFTMVLPSLVAWILGIIASINLSTYAYYIRGIIYKSAMRSLVQGVYASTVFAIVVQLLVLNTSFLHNIGTVAILIILYTFIVLYGVGALLIDRGARRLALIEVAAV